MILLIGGATHTGKTVCAQKLMEKYNYPYLSIDHLKMGLIRSGYTDLTPMDDDLLTEYLWPVVREMIKTAIENGQNMIVEGCYIPFDWKKDFPEAYADHVRYVCLVMSGKYIREHFADILAYENAIEHRVADSGLTVDALTEENEKNLAACVANGLSYVLIDGDYGDWPDEVFL